MKSFRSLARIHRMTLDELKRAVAELEGAREARLREAERIAAEMAAEAARIEAHHGALGDFASYFNAARARREAAMREARELDAAIAEMRERLGDAFRRTKTFELLENDRVLKERAEAKRREARALDESAALAHHRRRRAGH